MGLTTFLRILTQSIVGLVTTVLLLRFTLLLVGANPGVWFTQAVYSITDPLMQPFAGITPALSQQGSVFDLSVIIAMIVYALVGVGIGWILDLIDQSTKVRSLTERRNY